MADYRQQRLDLVMSGNQDAAFGLLGRAAMWLQEDQPRTQAIQDALRIIANAQHAIYPNA